MKFGHNLSRNQVPEWASAYIDYKGLKKLIKAAAQTGKEGREADLAGTDISTYSIVHHYAHADHVKNSSTPSIETSKTSTRSTERSTGSLQEGYGYCKIAMVEAPAILRASTVMSEMTLWELCLSFAGS
jgi:hypothetical protein